MGNPGDRYSATRHNVGFRTLDVLAARFRRSFKKPFLKNYLFTQVDLGADRMFLVKPLTFMNNSGDIFPEILKRTGAGLESILVVCDTMDLTVGQCRVKRSGSAAGQKGLASIIRRLGRQDFPRLYIGIGRPIHRDDVVRYVLSAAKGKEAVALEESVYRAAEAVVQLQKEGLEKVMNVFNRRAEGD
ncbi:MAG: aminoacyl-tRNA hydrolase [Spirochaetaceae bacterium]|nr:MAG: aminoacyl-tRNA hydrolase [Spirochaetaceae bacterium]